MWKSLSKTQKVVALLTGIAVFTTTFLTLSNILRDYLRETFGTPPWANKAIADDVAYVVAGWQYDRVKAELRDIQERIDKLNLRRSAQGALTVDDQRELDKLYRDQDRLLMRLKIIEQTKRPVRSQ